MTAAFIFLNSLFHFFISPFWEPEEPKGAHVRRIAKYSQQMHVAPTPTGPNWELVLYSLQTGWRSYVKRLGAVNFNGTFNDITTVFIAIVLKIIERKRTLCQTGVHRGNWYETRWRREEKKEKKDAFFFIFYLPSFLIAMIEPDTFTAAPIKTWNKRFPLAWWKLGHVAWLFRIPFYINGTSLQL